MPSRRVIRFWSAICAACRLPNSRRFLSRDRRELWLFCFRLLFRFSSSFACGRALVTTGKASPPNANCSLGAKTVSVSQPGVLDVITHCARERTLMLPLVPILLLPEPDIFIPDPSQCVRRLIQLSVAFRSALCLRCESLIVDDCCLYFQICPLQSPRSKQDSRGAVSEQLNEMIAQSLKCGKAVSECSEIYPLGTDMWADDKESVLSKYSSTQISLQKLSIKPIISSYVCRGEHSTLQPDCHGAEGSITSISEGRHHVQREVSVFGGNEETISKSALYECLWETAFTECHSRYKFHLRLLWRQMQQTPSADFLFRFETWPCTIRNLHAHADPSFRKGLSTSYIPILEMTNGPFEVRQTRFFVSTPSLRTGLQLHFNVIFQGPKRHRLPRSGMQTFHNRLYPYIQIYDFLSDLQFQVNATWTLREVFTQWLQSIAILM